MPGEIKGPIRITTTDRKGRKKTEIKVGPGGRISAGGNVFFGDKQVDGNQFNQEDKSHPPQNNEPQTGNQFPDLDYVVGETIIKGKVVNLDNQTPIGKKASEGGVEGKDYIYLPASKFPMGGRVTIDGITYRIDDNSIDHPDPVKGYRFNRKV